MDHFETLLSAYDERFEPKYGRLGAHVERQVRAYLDCGLLSAGFCRVVCPDCGHEFLLAFSCKTRYLCPSCHQRKALLWAEWVADEVVQEVPHRMWVFTVPKRVRPFFRYDRSLLGELPRLASKVLPAFFQAALERDDVRPGIISSIQTFNSDLEPNPHLHILASDGCFTADGAFVPLSITRKEDLRLLEEAFRREVLKLLLCRDLLTEQDVDGMLRWPHSGFGVSNSVKVPAGDRDGIVDVAKYLARAPVALSRLTYDRDGDGLVRLRLRRPHWKTGQSELVFEPLEFLARLLQHVPPLGFKMWRQYGAYATVVRAAERRRETTDQSDGVVQPPPKPPRRKRCSAAWAALLSRVWGFDPLLCPRCGSKLRILSPINDPQVIRRILTHLGLDPSAPIPTPARGPPPWEQGELDMIDLIPSDEVYFVDPPTQDDVPGFD